MASSFIPSASRDINNKSSTADVITINEKVNLSKQQHQVLRIICDTYEISVSKYMQQALVEAMRFDIEEGNFSEALLKKIGVEDSKNGKFSATQSLTNNKLDMFKKIQMQQV